MDINISLDILDRIARHCPRALSAYILCLRHADENGRCMFTADDLKYDLGESPTIFRNNLNQLSKEGIISWCTLNHKYAVDLTNDTYSELL